MNFYSMYNRPERKREKFDNQEQVVYKASYDKNGVRSLKVDKKVNIYEKIQEFANDVSLSSIFSKYGLNVYDQLKQSEEQFVDLSNLPTNLMEAMNVIDEAKYAFDRQSKEVKQKFNNSFKEFIAASETGKLAQVLNDEIKVSSERFKTDNMAYFDASKVNLVSHQVQEPQQVINQPLNDNMTQTISYPTQQGVNLNV